MMMNSKLEHMLHVCNLIAAACAAYATSFSVFFLLMHYHISSVSAFNVALFFIAAIFVKEYSKMRTSNHDGYFLSSHEQRMPPAVSMLMSVGVAFFCSIGLEALFLASLWVTLETMDGVSHAVKMMIYSGGIMFAVANLPIDILFYWNCLRKWLKTNSHVLSSKPGSRMMFRLFCNSARISSVFYCMRTVMFLYYFLPHFASFHPIMFFLFSGILACIVFRVNRFVMLQTIAETYREARGMQQPLRVKQKEQLNNVHLHVQALVYSLLFATPIIIMFQEAHVFVSLSARGAMLGLISVGCTLLLSYYVLNKNYLLRFLHVTCR